MLMRFSTIQDYINFMYDKATNNGSIQSIKDGFIDLYKDVALPFPENNYASLAELVAKKQINEDWAKLIAADKTFFKNNGYIEIEYDEVTNNAIIAKRQKGRPRSKNSPSKNISVRLTDEKLNKIDTYCKNHAIDNRSQFIKIAIDALLNNAASNK